MVEAESAEKEITAAERRRELERILGSEVFQRAPRLCSLLRYVCETTLAGRLEELTEQQIGIHVFQRSPGYNSGEDTIVRGTARHLRSRLEQYYREAGQSDPVRLSIPKGGYVAVSRGRVPWRSCLFGPIHRL